MSEIELVVLVVAAVALVIGVALAAPHFLRGFREARERRGVDLNMELRVEQELAEQRAGDEEWRRRIEADLEDKVSEWRDEPG